MRLFYFEPGFTYSIPLCNIQQTSISHVCKAHGPCIAFVAKTVPGWRATSRTARARFQCALCEPRQAWRVCNIDKVLELIEAQLTNGMALHAQRRWLWLIHNVDSPGVGTASIVWDTGSVALVQHQQLHAALYVVYALQLKLSRTPTTSM